MATNNVDDAQNKKRSSYKEYAHTHTHLHRHEKPFQRRCENSARCNGAPGHNEMESEIQTQTQALNSVICITSLTLLLLLWFGSIFSKTKDERLSIGLHILHEVV